MDVHHRVSGHCDNLSQEIGAVPAELVLQGIQLCEFDGPRARRVWIEVY